MGYVGTVKNVIANNNLVNYATHGTLIYTESESGTNSNQLIPYYATTNSLGQKVLTTSVQGTAVCMFYAKPVAKSLPVFRLKNGENGPEYISCNPYTLSGPGSDGGAYSGISELGKPVKYILILTLTGHMIYIIQTFRNIHIRRAGNCLVMYCRPVKPIKLSDKRLAIQVCPECWLKKDLQQTISGQTEWMCKLEFHNR
jgi:hypothetical protein